MRFWGTQLYVFWTQVGEAPERILLSTIDLTLLADFRQTVLRFWPLEDLTDLGVAPTRYVDDEHAFAFLPFGVTDDASRVIRRRLMSGVILPMLLEDRQ